MSSANSMYYLNEPVVARTVGELMDALASLAGDNPETAVLLAREDEHPLLTVTRDHGIVRVDIEPDNTETEVRRQLHECDIAIENGEPDLDARREYLRAKLPTRWSAFTEAERDYIRGALESFDAPPELNGVPDLEAELAETATMMED